MNATWVRRIAVTSVLLVGVVAAVISYNHIYELAARSGEQWRAALLPLSVDGMLVAATLAIVDRRRVGQRAGWVPWLGLALGIAASLAGNVAAARPDLISQIVAAWPPVALAVSIETLVGVLRRVSPSTTTEAPQINVEPPAEVPVGDDDPDPIAELIAEGAGRRRIAQVAGVSEHEARKMIASRTRA